MHREEATKRGDERLLSALLSNDLLPNGPRSLELQLDEAGILELQRVIRETAERLRDAGAAAEQRAAKSDSPPPTAVTVAIRFRAV